MHYSWILFFHDGSCFATCIPIRNQMAAEITLRFELRFESIKGPSKGIAPDPYIYIMPNSGHPEKQCQGGSIFES